MASYVIWNLKANLPHHWHFVRGINWTPVNSPHKGQWCRALRFSLISTWKKRLSKQSRCQWFEMPSHPLWRHCNVFPQILYSLLEMELQQSWANPLICVFSVWSVLCWCNLITNVIILYWAHSDETWWPHDVEVLCVSLALCVRNRLVTS